MIKGFKEFIMRGNVIDLAIAVVIGTAFQAVVKTIVEGIITPLLAATNPGSDVGLGFRIISDNKATFIDIGMVISAVITFLATALVVYLVMVVPMNKYKEAVAARKAASGKVEDPTVTELDVLGEIRDLLKK